MRHVTQICHSAERKIFVLFALRFRARGRFCISVPSFSDCLGRRALLFHRSN